LILIKKTFKLRSLLFLALISLFAAAPLAAQTEKETTQQENWLGSWFNLKPVDNHWYIGLYGGYTNNHLYTGGSSVDAYYDVYNIKYDNGHGFALGIPARFQIFNWLSIQAEALYSQKNYSFDRTMVDPDTPTIAAIDYHYSVTNHFLDIPLMANLSWGLGNTGIRVFGNIGLFTGVWLSSHEKGETISMSTGAGDKTSVDTDKTFNDKTDNRFDAGLLTGFGVQYDFNPLSLYLEARYHYSFTDLQKPYYEHHFIPRMNETWTVHLGILFNAKAFKGRRH
jgi:hypothetical protein